MLTSALVALSLPCVFRVLKGPTLLILNPYKNALRKALRHRHCHPRCRGQRIPCGGSEARRKSCTFPLYSPLVSCGCVANEDRRLSSPRLAASTSALAATGLSPVISSKSTTKPATTFLAALATISILFVLTKESPAIFMRALTSQV